MRSDTAPEPTVESSWVARFFRLLLAVAYIYAGVTHIRSPDGFLAITPAWVLLPDEVVFWTGVAEIAGGVGLLIPPRLVPHARKAAGVGLALYALCVWPANVNHAINDIAIGGQRLPAWYHGPRLALQPVIIWWALYAGGVIPWPFGRRR